MNFSVPEAVPPTKKRRLDDDEAQKGWDQVQIQNTFDRLSRLDSKCKPKMCYGFQQSWHCITMTEFGRISTEELRSALGTKYKLLDATVQFMGTNKAQIQLTIAEEGKKTSYQPAPYVCHKKHAESKELALLKLGKEDETMLQALGHYACNYNDQFGTPEGIKTQVLDSKQQQLWTPDKPLLSEYELQISGWHECTLAQLETFSTMFPWHVKQVEFDMNCVYVRVSSYLRPITRVWVVQ